METVAPVEADHEAILNSLPFLHTLETYRGVVSDVLPPDSPVYPNMPVRVSPYYMNRGDPASQGAYKLELGNLPSVYIQTTANEIGPHYELVTRDENGRRVYLDAAAEHEVASVLSHLTREHQPQLDEFVESRKRTLVARFAAWLVRKAI